jgi:hypothetical protein
MSDLDWYGTLQAVIVPALIGSFAVFWMRQACEETVPHELIEAARVDGCSVLRTFWHVAFPAVRPQAVQWRVTFPPGASAAEERSGVRVTSAEPHEGQTKGFRSRSAAISISASGARYSLMPRRPTVGPSGGA